MKSSEKSIIIGFIFEIICNYCLYILISGALFMIFSKNLLEKFEIDDPLTASPIHLGGGLVGIFLTPIFKQDGLIGT